MKKTGAGVPGSSDHAPLPLDAVAPRVGLAAFIVVPILTPSPVGQRAIGGVPGYSVRVFAFFSSRIGCLGSLLISVILTALLWSVLAR